MNPKISVIVPTYKVEKYLREALDSILHQTYSNWEALCINDGSPDGCGEILDEYARKDSRFKIFHQKNQGVSGARNRGLNNLSPDCEYVTFLDPDDILNLELFEVCIKQLCVNSLDMLSFKFKYVSENFSQMDATDVEGRLSRLVNGKKECFYFLWSQSDFLSMGACGRIWKKSCINNVRFLRGVKTGEDVMFNWMASYNYGRIMELDYFGYYYRANPNSILHSKHMRAAWHGWYTRTKLIAQFSRQGDDRFYKLLPLLGFTKQFSRALLYLARILKTTDWNSLRFSIDEKTWNPIFVFFYIMVFYFLKIVFAIGEFIFVVLKRT